MGRRTEWATADVDTEVLTVKAAQDYSDQYGQGVDPGHAAVIFNNGGSHYLIEGTASEIQDWAYRLYNDIQAVLG